MKLKEMKIKAIDQNFIKNVFQLADKTKMNLNELQNDLMVMLKMISDLETKLNDATVISKSQNKEQK